MAKECTDCTYFKDGLCTKNSKNGYKNCKKYKAVSMQDLIKERNNLLISKNDPDRLKYLTDKITLFNGGTI